jgi:hypothetical protein
MAMTEGVCVAVTDAEGESDVDMDTEGESDGESETMATERTRSPPKSACSQRKSRKWD